MKVVIFDWDNTLADMYTENPWDEAVTVLGELLAQNIQVFILTARPGDDPRADIRRGLEARGVQIALENLLWVGAHYTTHERAAYDKANTIDGIRLRLGYDKTDMLFVDDSHTNVKAAAQRGYPTITVPRLCYYQYAIPAVWGQARNEFFAEVKRQAMAEKKQATLANPPIWKKFGMAGASLLLLGVALLVLGVLGMVGVIGMSFAAWGPLYLGGVLLLTAGAASSSASMRHRSQDQQRVRASAAQRADHTSTQQLLKKTPPVNIISDTELYTPVAPTKTASKIDSPVATLFQRGATSSGSGRESDSPVQWVSDDELEQVATSGMSNKSTM